MWWCWKQVFEKEEIRWSPPHPLSQTHTHLFHDQLPPSLRITGEESWFHKKDSVVSPSECTLRSPNKSQRISSKAWAQQYLHGLVQCELRGRAQWISGLTVLPIKIINSRKLEEINTKYYSLEQPEPVDWNLYGIYMVWSTDIENMAILGKTARGGSKGASAHPWSEEMGLRSMEGASSYDGCLSELGK